MHRLIGMLFLGWAILLPLTATNAYSQQAVLARLAQADSIPATHIEETKEIRKSEYKDKRTSREFYFEKGNKSFKFKYGARIQTRFDSWQWRNSDNESGNKLYFRRIRFKSDGHLFTERFGYKVEIDLLNPNVLDAVLKWRFNKNLMLMAGQTKLRGNRERVISSQNLQLVDRSLLNAKFTLDRDIGFWLLHTKDFNGIEIRSVLSVSKGEGLHINRGDKEPYETGLDYTARLEVLPFGAFQNKGDYTGGDLLKEPTPKLSVGMSYSYNDNAVRSRGQKGSTVDQSADLSTWVADLMFKYNGFSLMTEYTYRQIGGISPRAEIVPSHVHNFYLGQAFNTQAGYMLGKGFEVAGRYTIVSPFFNNPQLTEYTIGLSKYIVGHKIKVQTDYGIFTEGADERRSLYRMQFEFSL